MIQKTTPMIGPNSLKNGNSMEQLNKVELKGFVGRADTKPIGDTMITRFSVATNYAYESNGSPVVETTWHSCVSFDKKAAELKTGDNVHLIGRIRRQRFTDTEGQERDMVDIFVNNLEILN